VNKRRTTFSFTSVIDSTKPDPSRTEILRLDPTGHANVGFERCASLNGNVFQRLQLSPDLLCCLHEAAVFVCDMKWRRCYLSVRRRTTKTREVWRLSTTASPTQTTPRAPPAWRYSFTTTPLSTPSTIRDALHSTRYLRSIRPQR